MPAPFIRPLMALALLCAACSKVPEKTAVPVSGAPAPAAAGNSASQPVKEHDEQQAKEQERQVMQALFPKHGMNADGDFVVTLTDPDKRNETGRYAVRLDAKSTLPTGETIVVLNAAMVDEHDVPEVAHVTPALLNLFVLKQVDGKWQVLARHENINELGSDGEMGQIHWISPGKGRNGLAIEHGGTWSGNTITELALYDVSNGKVRALTKGSIPIHSDNDGGCGPGGDCWDTDGHWSFASREGSEYDDLVIDFVSKTWTGSDDEEPGTEKLDASAKPAKAPPLLKETKAHARYRFDGNDMKLIEGKNPTPPV